MDPKTGKCLLNAEVCNYYVKKKSEFISKLCWGHSAFVFVPRRPRTLCAAPIRPSARRPTRGPISTLEAAVIGPLARAFPTVSAASPEAAAEARPAETEGLFAAWARTRDEFKEKLAGDPMFKPPPGETGWDRLKEMYSTDKFGEVGPEWSTILQGITVGGVAGITIGFFTGGRGAVARFIERNEATKFQNDYYARRALQDKMTLSMASNAVKWGWRTSLFTTLYLFAVTHMSVYRGKSSVLDYAFAGGFAGTVWKFFQGPKAMVVGCGLGGFLGLLAGATSLTILRAAGLSLEEMRHWHYQTRYSRYGEVGKILPPTLDGEESASVDEKVSVNCEKERSAK